MHRLIDKNGVKYILPRVLDRQLCLLLNLRVPDPFLLQLRFAQDLSLFLVRNLDQLLLQFYNLSVLLSNYFIGLKLPLDFDFVDLVEVGQHRPNVAL